MKVQQQIIGAPKDAWFEWPCYVCKAPLNTTEPDCRLCQDCRKKMYQGLCKKLFPDCDLTPDPDNIYLFHKEIPILEQYWGPMGNIAAYQERLQPAIFWADTIPIQNHTGCVERLPDMKLPLTDDQIKEVWTRIQDWHDNMKQGIIAQDNIVTNMYNTYIERELVVLAKHNAEVMMQQHKEDKNAGTN